MAGTENPRCVVLKLFMVFCLVAVAGLAAGWLMATAIHGSRAAKLERQVVELNTLVKGQQSMDKSMATTSRLAAGYEVWGYKNGVIEVEDPEDSLLTLTGGHEHSITALAISPDGRWLVSGDKAGYLGVWDLKEKRFLHHVWSPPLPLSGIGDGVSMIVFTPSGGWTIVAGDTAKHPVVRAVHIPSGVDLDFSEVSIPEVGEYVGGSDLLRESPEAKTSPTKEAIRQYHLDRAAEIVRLSRWDLPYFLPVGEVDVRAVRKEREMRERRKSEKASP